jgi:hypothetical protein
MFQPKPHPTIGGRTLLVNRPVNIHHSNYCQRIERLVTIGFWRWCITFRDIRFILFTVTVLLLFFTVFLITRTMDRVRKPNISENRAIVFYGVRSEESFWRQLTLQKSHITVKYGREFHWTRTRKWLCWRGKAAIVNDRPVRESASHQQTRQVYDGNRNLAVSPRWVLYFETDWLTDRRS